MWRFRTGTTGANKVKTMNTIGVKVVGKAGVAKIWILSFGRIDLKGKLLYILGKQLK